MNNIAPQSPVMRRLTLQDNPAIARVIRQVSAEYGLTADKGYTVADPNLDELYQVYSQRGHAYWVVEYNGEVVGGGGIAPLTGSEADICELQKMYFLPAIRGKGLAKTGLNGDGAGTRNGLQTLLSGNDRFLKEAIGLYEHLGFQHIDYALGCTGHVDCEVRMLREL
ncbi:GNAT family N-acetyltransferase [Escherichia coli]|nr:GNAT family N-acetyltransferase [Escherichia coli]MBW9313350.1 GNAT family N-acetyltransferase [Escherichia coli]